MAVTSIWRVKGWLGKLVIYVENPDKTTNPKSVKAEGLEDVLRYAVNSSKTQKADDEDAEILHSFVSGINCHPSTARQEMNAVKKRFGKEGGVVAYHGYQSFAPGEATPEIAHEIGVKLAQELWGKGYQVIVATHLDKQNHLHSHFVVNTVSFVNGIRYHRTAKDYHDMQTISDRLCREYNLSVIENGKWGIPYETKTGTKRCYFAKYSDCKGKADPTDTVCNAAVEYGYCRTALEQRLKAKICELCGTTESDCYEIHHVNKLKNLKGKKAWEIIMIAKRRKTLVVCKKCHIAIHNQ